MPNMKNPDTRRNPMSPPAKSMQGKRNNAGPRQTSKKQMTGGKNLKVASAAAQKVMGKKGGR